VFHGLLLTVEDGILGYTVTASHYITVAAWDLLCDVLLFFWIVCTAFYGDVQRLEVGIYDVWHAHLFVVVRELYNVFTFLRHFRSLWLHAYTLAVISVVFQ